MKQPINYDRITRVIPDEQKINIFKLQIYTRNNNNCTYNLQTSAINWNLTLKQTSHSRV